MPEGRLYSFHHPVDCDGNDRVLFHSFQEHDHTAIPAAASPQAKRANRNLAPTRSVGTPSREFDISFSSRCSPKAFGILLRS